MREKYNASFLICPRMLILIIFCALCVACSDANKEGINSDTDTSTEASDIVVGSDTTFDTQTGNVDGGTSCAAATNIESCQALNGCAAIWAWKAYLEGDCYGPEKTFIDCVVGGLDCEDDLGHALDPKTGGCYQFPSLCFPEGWTAVDNDHSSCIGSSVSLCPE